VGNTIVLARSFLYISSDPVLSKPQKYIMNSQTPTEGTKTKITLGLVISYIFSIVAFLMSLMSLAEGSYMQATLFFASATIAFAPFRARLAKDYHFTLSSGLVFVLALGLFAYGISGITKRGRDARVSGTDSSSVVQQPVEKILEVKATTMSREYKENEVAADEKYRGKTLRISGSVESIGKDILDKPYVALYAYEYAIIDKVQCYFTDADNAILSKLKKGQKVTLQGEVGRKMGNIYVDGCSVIQ
jgi:tRNA_anti-like